MSNYGCQQHLIHPNKDLSAVLEFLCGESAKLSNCGTYYARQLYFKAGKIPGKYDLHKLFKSNVHFQAMYSHVAQQCLTTVAESFKSFIGLLKGIKEGTVEQCPRLPGYLKGGLALVTYPKRVVNKIRKGCLTTTSQSAHIYEYDREDADRKAELYYKNYKLEHRKYNDDCGDFVIEVVNREMVVSQLSSGGGVKLRSWNGRNISDLITKIISNNPTINPHHAAYLGCELEKAWTAWRNNERYTQDR